MLFDNLFFFASSVFTAFGICGNSLIVQAVSEIFGTERRKASKLAQMFLILRQSILEEVPKKSTPEFDILKK